MNCIVSRVIGNETVYYNKEFDIISTSTISAAKNDDIIYNRTLAGEVYDSCFEITTRCNQRCKNCFAASVPGAGGKDLPYRFVEDYIRSVESRRIRIAITGGEPFLHPEINRFLRLPSLFPDLNYVISTNGYTKMDHEKTDALADGGWLISVSLHGREEAHNRYTESQSFETVVKNLKLLSAFATVHIYSVMNPFMSVSDVDFLVSLTDLYGIAFLRFITPREAGRYDGRYSRELFEYAGRLADSNPRIGIKNSSSRTELIHVNGETGFAS